MFPLQAILAQPSTILALGLTTVGAIWYWAVSSKPRKQRVIDLATWCSLGGVVIATFPSLDALADPKFYAIPLCVGTASGASPWWLHLASTQRLLNVLLFVPFSLALLWRGERILTVLMYSAGLTLTIELIQGLSGAKACSANDVFDNLFGAVAMTTIWMLIAWARNLISPLPTEPPHQAAEPDRT